MVPEPKRLTLGAFLPSLIREGFTFSGLDTTTAISPGGVLEALLNAADGAGKIRGSSVAERKKGAASGIAAVIRGLVVSSGRSGEMSLTKVEKKACK